jgi:hypothetical protein
MSELHGGRAPLARRGDGCPERSTPRRRCRCAPAEPLDFDHGCSRGDCPSIERSRGVPRAGGGRSPVRTSPFPQRFPIHGVQGGPRRPRTGVPLNPRRLPDSAGNELISPWSLVRIRPLLPIPESGMPGWAEPGQSLSRDRSQTCSALLANSSPWTWSWPLPRWLAPPGARAGWTATARSARSATGVGRGGSSSTAGADRSVGRCSARCGRHRSCGSAKLTRPHGGLSLAG